MKGNPPQEGFSPDFFRRVERFPGKGGEEEGKRKEEPDEEKRTRRRRTILLGEEEGPSRKKGTGRKRKGKEEGKTMTSFIQEAREAERGFSRSLFRV